MIEHVDHIGIAVAIQVHGFGVHGDLDLIENVLLPLVPGGERIGVYLLQKLGRPGRGGDRLARLPAERPARTVTGAKPETLLSSQAARAANAAFSRLTDAMASRPTGSSRGAVARAVISALRRAQSPIRRCASAPSTWTTFRPRA